MRLRGPQLPQQSPCPCCDLPQARELSCLRVRAESVKSTVVVSSETCSEPGLISSWNVVGRVRWGWLGNPYRAGEQWGRACLFLLAHRRATGLLWARGSPLTWGRACHRRWESHGVGDLAGWGEGFPESSLAWSSLPGL